MTGWLLRTNGNVEKADENLHKQGGRLPLAALYQAIGCSIVERVTAPWGQFWVDEEGRLKGHSELNELATQIYWETFPHVKGQPLVGDIYLRVKASGKTAKRLVEALEIRAANGALNNGRPGGRGYV